MDVFTKEILAFTLSISLEVDFVMLMIQDLFDNHKSELKTDTLIHSDQGCHYTSNKFIDISTKCLQGETEQSTLNSTADTLKIEVESIKEKTANVNSFFKLVEKFDEITELTPEIARSFIQKIVVHEKEKNTNSVKQTISQRIEIYFNHIGQYDSN